MVLFGFGTDLRRSRDAEFDRFRECVAEAAPGNISPLVQAICVAGVGYWYHSEQMYNGQHRRGWWTGPAPIDHAEILGFLAGVVNTPRLEKPKRYGLPFGPYVMDEFPVSPAD